MLFRSHAAARAIAGAIRRSLPVLALLFSTFSAFLLIMFVECRQFEPLQLRSLCCIGIEFGEISTSFFSLLPRASAHLSARFCAIVCLTAISSLARTGRLNSNLASGVGGSGNLPAFFDKPEIDAIYDGEVTATKEFGAFVRLQGFRTRTEGELAQLSLSLQHVVTS
mgnify:CR=1 FL=1